jgi:hypothetical protein
MALLRFMGIANAAIWMGVSFFFTLSIGPALFSKDVLDLFGGPGQSETARYFAGSVAQILLERYFFLQTACGAVALLLLLAEWFYTGRPFHEVTLGLALGLFLVVLVGAYGIQPKLHQLHRTMYGVGARVTQVQAAQARRAFKLWHGLSQILNLGVLGGTAVFMWRTSQPPSSIRFLNRGQPGPNQFRI